MTESFFEKRCRDFTENYSRIKEKIALAAERSGRSPDEISLLAATKTVPPELINFAISGGIKLIGENRAQEFRDKYEALDKSCEMHFIGALQANKLKYLIGKVSTVQSLDSVELAHKISEASEKAGVNTSVFAEVNIGREPQKSGVLPEQLFEFLDEIRSFAGIKVTGLMAIPPENAKKDEIRRYFTKMSEYALDIEAKKIDNITISNLSMGMSADYEDAVECGATMVRIGSALFGERIKI